MGDSSISKFVVSYGGKDADIDVVYRDGQKLLNATKLNQTFGSGKESERVNHFLLKDSTREFIIQKYTELTVIEEKHKEIKDLLNVTDSNLLNVDAVRTYLSSTNKKSLPPEILEPFVHTKKGRGGATYLSEDLFLDYAMYLSAQIKSVVIEVFKKYGWVENLPQDKKSDALLAMSLNEEIKHVSEQYPTRVEAENIAPALSIEEGTNDIISVEDVDEPLEIFKARLEEDPKVRAATRVKHKLTTQLLKDTLLKIVQNEKRTFESEEAQQAHVSQYFVLLFDTMYLALFDHSAREMRMLLEQDYGTPRDAMTIDCLLAIDTVESHIQRELYHLVKTKKTLTREGLINIVVECCNLPVVNLFKYAKEIDFLVRDKKIKKENQIKQIDVTLDDAYRTRVRTAIVNLPKTAKVKKLSDKVSKTGSIQLSFFGDDE